MAKKNKKDLSKALQEVFGWTPKLNCWLDAQRKVVATIPFRPESYLPDTHILLEAIRHSHNWCCITIDSDYCYVWDMMLTPAQGWGKDADPDYVHEIAVKAQGDTFQEVVVNCLFKIQEYNALNPKS
jgi:hypothetical protein